MKSLLLVVPVALFGLAGCVQTGPSYQNTGVVSQQQSLNGTIVAVRNVQIDNPNDRTAGAVTGALVGGLVGNQLGGGRGRDVTTVLGAAGGALAGSQLAAGANSRVTQQWTVRLEDGRSVIVTQDGNFGIGQRVRIVTQGNSTRIVG
jgi:outer membrane lipoprotein SlyB